MKEKNRSPLTKISDGVDRTKTPTPTGGKNPAKGRTKNYKPKGGY